MLQREIERASKSKDGTLVKDKVGNIFNNKHMTTEEEQEESLSDLNKVVNLIINKEGPKASLEATSNSA